INAEIAGQVGHVGKRAELLDALPKLRTTVEGTDIPLWRVLAATQGDYPAWSTDGGGGFVSGGDQRGGGAGAESINGHGVAELADLVAATGISEEILTAWLTQRLGYEVRDGGRVLTLSRKIGDRAAAELYLAGEPLTVDELASRLDDRSPRSVANA